MANDAELLRRYAREGDEGAFAEVVRRQLDAVYSAALRRVGGDVHLAEDVAQQVFAAAAREAGRLAGHAALTGWFYATTRNVAANVVRAERRRKQRETEAAAMSAAEEEEADWGRVAPLLDAAIDRLSESERAVVLLRFIERRGFAEIGAALRVSEDAARMRLERALERLRGLLAQRGVRSSAAALAVALTNGAVMAAPAGMVATVSGAALSGAMAAGATGASGFMSITIIGLAGALAVAGVVGFAVQSRENAALRREIAAAGGLTETAAALRAENGQLAAAAAEVEALRSDGRELERLRAVAAEAQRRKMLAAARVVSASAAAVAPGVGRTGTAGELVQLTLPDADFATAFSAYQIYAKKRIVQDPSMTGLRGIVNVKTGVITKEEAMALIRAELARKGVELVPATDGSLIARRIVR